MTTVQMTTIKNFIGGEFVDSVSGATMPLVDPSTGEEHGTAPISNEQDIDNAYTAAAKAFADWKRTTPSHRQKALLGFADDVEKAAEELVAAEGRKHRQAHSRHHGRRDPADARPGAESSQLLTATLHREYSAPKRNPRLLPSPRVQQPGIPFRGLVTHRWAWRRPKSPCQPRCRGSVVAVAGCSTGMVSVTGSGCG